MHCCLNGKVKKEEILEDHCTWQRKFKKNTLKK